MRLTMKCLGATILLFLINITLLRAQPENPCEGQDPDDTSGCPVPLDTWVILLAIAAVGFGAWYLHKNQKRFFIQ